MVEISLLSDELRNLNITPADLVAIGAGLTAAAVAMIAAKEALVRVNMTADQRLQKAEMAAEKAEAITEAMTGMIDVTLRGSADIVKEALMVGSVLPDKV